mgnify:CR=1 FL=1
MTRIPPIGSLRTAGKVVSQVNKTAKNILPHELPLPDKRESQLINLLHPGTPLYNAKQEIQTTLNTHFKSFNK